MPELPDITVYIEQLRPRIQGQVLQKVDLASPFLLRSVDPPLTEFVGKPIRELRRLGKRIVWCFDGERFLVLHLMIAGRLHWKPPDAKVPGKIGLAAFRFPNGTLTLTEAGSKKRASLHLVRSSAALKQHDPGGLGALTDPRLFDGIGNAYSDEILHAAGLSPLGLSQRLDPEAIARLFEAARTTLLDWTERLRRQVGDGFPEKVTAFLEGMAVHGRFGQPCPECGATVQRIVYAENETNYCPGCQTNGKVLADRSLSRLLKDDWPRTLEELEESFRSCNQR